MKNKKTGKKLYMILDIFTGENIQFAGKHDCNFGDNKLSKLNKRSIGTIREALDFLEKHHHEKWKWIVVELLCISPKETVGKTKNKKRLNSNDYRRNF